MGIFEKLQSFLREVDREIISLAEHLEIYPELEEPEILYKYAKFRTYTAGKRFRPALILATNEAFGGKREAAVPLALAFEVKHGGYLDIDDVLDRSPLRRGKPATYRIIGDEQAILVGLYNADALPWKCISYGTKFWSYETTKYILDLIFRTKKETVGGESLDIEERRSEKLTISKQLKIYRMKTGAYTFGGPMAGGAKTANVETSKCERLYQLGRDLGIAFQIQDDLLNIRPITSEEAKKYHKKYGKMWADDLNEGKPTLPRAIFNEVASENDKRKFYELCGRLEPPLTFEERVELVELLEKYNVTEEAKKIAKRYVSSGIEKLKKIVPFSKESENFYNLIKFAIEREW